MKYKYILLSICLIFFLVIPAFSQDVQWEKSFGGKHDEYLADAIPTADYGFILAGSSLSNKTGNKSEDNIGDLDYWVWKMDENGEPEWQKTFGGNGMDMLQSIKNTRDGGFVLAGTSNSSNENKNNVRNDKAEPSRGGDDFWIIKLDANGGMVWQKTIGGSGQEKLHTIVQTRDGGFIIGGSSSSDTSLVPEIGSKEATGEKSEDSFGNMDYWIVKLDGKGKIEWQKTYGGIYFDELRSIEQTTDDGFIAGGYSNSPSSGNKLDENIGDGDYWIIKLDKNGVLQWQKTIGGREDDQLEVVHQTYDNGYILGGYSSSGVNNNKNRGNNNGIDFWIVKLNDEGAIQWQETFDVGALDVISSIIENDDHSLLLGGYAQSEVEESNRKEEEGINDYIGIKITEKGEEIWRRSVGSAGKNLLKKAIETRDGGYLFAGTSNPEQSNKRTIQTLEAKKGKSLNIDNGEVYNPVQDQTTAISNEINGYKDKANEFYKENTEKISDKVTDAIGLDKNSPLKFGISSPLTNNSSGEGENALNGIGGENANNVKAPPSKDKKNNLGKNDFWVIKLKDESKPKVVRLNIEAMPNPATSYTNVLIGYEFISGTATVVDMGGRILQQFKISSRTVPVDLSRYPNGIYVINIKTEVQSDGVKVIKGNGKN